MFKTKTHVPSPHNKAEPAFYQLLYEPGQSKLLLLHLVYNMKILGMFVLIFEKRETLTTIDSYTESSFYLHNHRTRSGWHGPMSLLAQCYRKANGTSTLWSFALILGSISPTLYPELGREQAFVSKICNSPGGRSISLSVYPMLHGEIKENMSANWEQVRLH